MLILQLFLYCALFSALVTLSSEGRGDRGRSGRFDLLIENVI